MTPSLLADFAPSLPNQSGRAQETCPLCGKHPLDVPTKKMCWYCDYNLNARQATINVAGALPVAVATT